jgi:hypothetical protein
LYSFSVISIHHFTNVVMFNTSCRL